MGKTIINHPPVITIFIGGMPGIHKPFSVIAGWCSILFPTLLGQVWIIPSQNKRMLITHLQYWNAMTCPKNWVRLPYFTSSYIYIYMDCCLITCIYIYIPFPVMPGWFSNCSSLFVPFFVRLPYLKAPCKKYPVKVAPAPLSSRRGPWLWTSW